MEKLIVVSFDDETKANAGFQALRQLDRAGEISVYEMRIIVKEPSGSIRFIDTTDETAFPVIGGATVVGAFVGLLSGPFGVVSGGMAGALISSIVHAGRLVPLHSDPARSRQEKQIRQRGRRPVAG